jgi:two-component system sensor histidine kinase KdpD
MRRASANPSTTVVAIAGIVAIAVITTVWAAFFDDAASEVPALLLLLVITAVSVTTNWRVGVPIAVVAGITHALVVLPNFGHIDLGYTEDVVTLLTFVLVAVLVSVLVSRRSIANHAELIGRERMLLLRSVSHDLRNPLSSILAASTELIDGADHAPDARRRLLGVISDEAHRVDRIVDNLLGLSRLQAGALVPDRQAVSVADLLDRQRRRFGLIGGPDDRLDVVGTADLIVDADPVQLDQVLTNLVENAVRHGTSPVHVTIGVAARGDVVEWRVSDDGPGFSAVARAALFAPFHSTDGSSGLGLTVCRAVIEAHHGSIAVDDAGPGAAITFTVPRGS